MKLLRKQTCKDALKERASKICPEVFFLNTKANDVRLIKLLVDELFLRMSSAWISFQHNLNSSCLNIAMRLVLRTKWQKLNMWEDLRGFYDKQILIKYCVSPVDIDLRIDTQRLISCWIERLTWIVLTCNLKKDCIQNSVTLKSFLEFQLKMVKGQRIVPYLSRAFAMITRYEE